MKTSQMRASERAEMYAPIQAGDGKAGNVRTARVLNPSEGHYSHSSLALALGPSKEERRSENSPLIPQLALRGTLPPSPSLPRPDAPNPCRPLPS